MAALGTSPSTLTDAADVIALLVLLSEFAMLRSSLSRSQVRLYGFQSLCVSVLAGFVAATQHIGELYGLMGLSFVLKVIVVPMVILRLVREVRVDVTASHRLGLPRWCCWRLSCPSSESSWWEVAGPLHSLPILASASRRPSFSSPSCS